MYDLKKIVIIISLWIILLMGVYALLLRIRNALLFHPNVPLGARKLSLNPPGFRSPTERGIPFEEVYLSVSTDVILHGWLMLQETPRCELTQTVVYFKGNAGNIGLRLPHIELLYKELGVNIFIISYRGYGQSTGSPSVSGILEDAKASMRFVVDHKVLSKTPIFIFGRSLGGAVAINAASQFSGEIYGLILENTFSNLAAMAIKTLPFLLPIKPIVEFKERNSLNIEKTIKSLSLPITFISGQQDGVVPPTQMETLYEAAQNKRILRVPKGKHNDTWIVAGTEYIDFLAKALRPNLVEKLVTTNSDVAQVRKRVTASNPQL